MIMKNSFLLPHTLQINCNNFYDIGVGDISQLVEDVFSKCEALSLIPSKGKR